MSEDITSHNADQRDTSVRSATKPDISDVASETSATPQAVSQQKDEDTLGEKVQEQETVPKFAGREGRPKEPSEEDFTCPYSPLNWVCKGYDPLEEYQYFDGVPGSPDQRFLIDLEKGSMDG
jgi:hypothetical protein